LTLAAKAKAQYTYAVYGGTAYHSEDSTNQNYKNHYVYFFSQVDQKIKLTNYNGYDTVIQLDANKSKSHRIPRRLVSIPLYLNGKVIKRGVFLESKFPVQIIYTPLIGKKALSDPFDLGQSGTYSVFEKQNCGSNYTLYYPQSLCGYHTDNVNKNTKYNFTFSVLAFEDSTWIEFDLNFVSDKGKKFEILLQKGEAFQISQLRQFINLNHYTLYDVELSQIRSKNCKKPIAVFISNLAVGVNLNSYKYSWDATTYPAWGVEIEQLHPSNKWGYEYLLVSDGKSYKGNTYHIKNIGVN
jgi:hypothetical protein